jgi:hypothetical protein
VRGAAALLVGLVVALLIASPAIADTKRVTWTNATHNTDGTAIPTTGDGRLVRTTIEYGTCTGTAPNKTFGTKQGEIFVAAPANQAADLPLIVVQEFCLAAFHSTGYATTFAPCLLPLNTNCPLGNSERSNIFVTQGGPPRPRVPTTLAVAANSPIAWAPVTTEEALTAIAVGVAREGSSCDTTQSFSSPYVADGATLYRVAIPDVDLLPGQEPLVAFTRCSG